jgi:hypothetical protein
MLSESVSNEETRAELLNEFRQLSMLRAMLASINSDGRQVVKSAGGPAILSLERRQAPHRLAMNAVATLLIRQSEVVAVTTPTNYDLRLHVVSAPADTLDVLALQETEREQNVNNLAFVEFAAVANPESENVIPFGDGDEVTVVPPGKARWLEILENPWEKIATR